MRVLGQHSRLKEAKKALLSFYLVGTLGMILPWTSPFFKQLTPYSLLFSYALLAWFHRPKANGRTLSFFLFVVLTSFAVEVIGVATGRIFGPYSYGGHLGFKLFDTPVLIGLNWLFLVYASTILLQASKLPVVLKVVLAALTMVLYDVVAEQVAPTLGMWRFAGGLAPFRNYLAWFGLAVVFHSLLQSFKIRFSNPLAVWLLTVQFLFFGFLWLFLPK